MKSISLRDFRNKDSHWKSVLNWIRTERTFPDNLALSAIAARVCYSEADLFEIIKEEKVRDIEKRKEFLDKLYNKGHTSVFAHSPLTFELLEFPVEPPYKMWKYGNYYCANARHLVEIGKVKPSEVIRDKEVNIRLAIAKDSGITIYGLYIPDTEPWHWMSFIAHGISVICTHQWVRHTWQNFNQRSHRYTRVDDIIIPEQIRCSRVEDLVAGAISTYNWLLGNGYNRDLARFVTPSGRTTTLMGSGPYFVWEHFVELRTKENTSFEIRKVATKIGELVRTLIDGKEEMTLRL